MSKPASGDGSAPTGGPDRSEIFRDFLRRIPPELEAPEPESPRGRILKSARSLFARGGFERTTTRAIADSARVNQAMIHYYFGSKEQLYRRVISLEIIAMFRGITERIVGERVSEEILVRIPLEIMGEMRENSERRELLRREIGQGGRQAALSIAAMQEFGPRGFRHLVATLLEDGMREGRMRELPDDAILPFVLSVGYGSMMLEPLFRAVFGQDAADDTVWVRRVKAFDALLRHGLLAEEKE